jgi:hypothetical protein
MNTIVKEVELTFEDYNKRLMDMSRYIGSDGSGNYNCALCDHKWRAYKRYRGTYLRFCAMTVHLVTFSDESMSRSREVCARSAKLNGCDEEWQYEQRHMGHSDHVKAHPSIFRQPEDMRRAWAWWAWKPVIIADAMRRAAECYDDKEQYVVYADAGIEFINNVSHIIERMDQDIFLFGNNWQHAHWCKRDIVEAVWPTGMYGKFGISAGRSWETFGKQCQASVIFFRVSDYSRRFVKEWLGLVPERGANWRGRFIWKG